MEMLEGTCGRLTNYMGPLEREMLCLEATDVYTKGYFVRLSSALGEAYWILPSQPLDKSRIAVMEQPAIKN